jgi:hypothetical protein
MRAQPNKQRNEAGEGRALLEMERGFRGLFRGADY